MKVESFDPVITLQIGLFLRFPVVYRSFRGIPLKMMPDFPIKKTEYRYTDKKKPECWYTADEDLFFNYSGKKKKSMVVKKGTFFTLFSVLLHM